MKTLFCLTLLGGGFTLILAGLKGPLLRRCGGRWYRCIWLLALAAYTIPYKIALPEILQGSGMSLPAGGGGAVGGFPEATGIYFPAVIPFPQKRFPYQKSCVPFILSGWRRLYSIPYVFMSVSAADWNRHRKSLKTKTQKPVSPLSARQWESGDVSGCVKTGWQFPLCLWDFSGHRSYCPNGNFRLRNCA